MGLIAGLGRTYAAQRGNAALVDQEETRIRQLAALRAGDDDYNYNKRMDRAAQEANARVTPGMRLPDAMDVPESAAAAAPVATQADFPQAWAKRQDGPPREKKATAPDQSTAESARLARQRPHSAGSGTVGSTAPRTIAEAALQASGRAGGRPMYIENVRGKPPTGFQQPTQPAERNYDANMAAFRELQSLNNTNTPVATPQGEYNARLAAAGAPDPRAAQWDNTKTPYDAQIEAAARQAGVDPIVFRRLIGSESSFNPAATNGVAHGIAQVYRSNIGVGPGQLSMQDALDPSKALPWAAQHLRQKIDAAGGDVQAGLLAYKGAVSEAGRASMMPVAQAILSGTRYGQSTPAAPSTAAPAPSVPSGGMGATAAAAQPPAAKPLSPEQYVRVAQAATSDLRYHELEVERLTDVLKYTRDPGTQRQLQQQIAGLQNNRYELQLVRAMASGAAGNFQALSQLAQVAGVSFRPAGPQQVQLVRPDGTGNFVPGPTVPAALFAQHLYQSVSPAARAAAAKQRDRVAEVEAKGGYDLALENLKQQGAMAKAGIEGEQRVREALIKHGLSERDVQGYHADQNGQGGVVVLKNGELLRFEPGRSIDGMQSAPTLTPVARQ